jgi:hemerythrin-like domain-containing protein
MADTHSKEPARGRPDVFAAMRHEHQALVERLDSLERGVAHFATTSSLSPEDEETVRSFVTHLEAQFATHMRSEDEVVYPLLESTVPGTQASLAPLRAEHEELRSMLASLCATLAERAGAARNEQIAVQAQDMADLLRIHIRKEEAVVFAVAERLMRPEELSALGARLAAFASSPSTTARRAPRA